MEPANRANSFRHSTSHGRVSRAPRNTRMPALRRWPGVGRTSAERRHSWSLLMLSLPRGNLCNEALFGAGQKSDAANSQRKPEFKRRPKSPGPPEGRKCESAECSEELD